MVFARLCVWQIARLQMFLPNAEVQLGYLYKILGCNKLHTHTLTSVFKFNFFNRYLQH